MEGLIAAIHADHANEIAKLKMQLVRYRASLEENGIEPPDAEGADLLEMWRVCANVIQAAHLCVEHLGTSKELVLWGNTLPKLRS